MMKELWKKDKVFPILTVISPIWLDLRVFIIIGYDLDHTNSNNRAYSWIMLQGIHLLFAGLRD